MENKNLLIAVLIFFLIVNTSCLWESKLGSWASPLFVFLLIYFFALVVVLLYQIVWTIKQKLKRIGQFITLGIMAVVLCLAYFWPDGIIDCRKDDGPFVFVAEREGAANCYTTLKLKPDNKFVEKSICFGISMVRGSYSVKGDSIFFSDIQTGRDVNEYYQFAVIKQSASENKKIIGELKRFMNYSDTLPHELWITKNELRK